ncbi:unnamed protein product [Allacma fusca]|uniref:Uncharacterized protein n=1 Tax=Allacma fusca TaxID=39272 RepID=A0A8J2K0M7_9HEXA|nr:unnamed protein product [Allacma fusca]
MSASQQELCGRHPVDEPSYSYERRRSSLTSMPTGGFGMANRGAAHPHKRWKLFSYAPSMVRSTPATSSVKMNRSPRFHKGHVPESV